MVDFPPPDKPTSATVSPRVIRNDTCSSARVPPSYTNDTSSNAISRQSPGTVARASSRSDVRDGVSSTPKTRSADAKAR
jgi:hypothetical protein